ncbi:MAG: hypothetical protein ACAI44_04260, partial [Candidatus Sericytochromatia bacterium]
MRTLLAFCASLMLLSACGPGPAASNPNNPGNSSNPGNGTTASGNPTTSKQAYIAFLTCAKTKARTEQERQSIDASITAVSAINDAQWAV